MKIKNINLIKVVGILLVIIIHFGPMNYAHTNDKLDFNFFLLYRSFLAIGVALLLIVNGYLVINKNYSLKKILINIVHLAILLFVFKFIYALTFNELNFTIDSFLYSLMTTAAKNYRVNHLWFMYALIAIYFLLPLISKIFENKKLYLYLTILVCSYSFGFIIIETIFNLTNNYEMQLFQTLYPFQTHYLFALSYFLLGGLIRQYEDKIKNLQINNIVLILIMLSSLVIQALYFVFINNLSQENFDPMYNGYSTLTTALNATILFYLLKYRVRELNHKHLDGIAYYSLGIYLIHWPLAFYLKKQFLSNYFVLDYLSNIIISLVILLICYLLCYLLGKNKYLQKLIKL
ncbi:acyltransferase [Erysipelotrichaceae bacterium OttesenSCG-928-M19]|nr:acyltransferase [Erysipelotrichaceae bacterium OttesenSCG-928-M19]